VRRSFASSRQDATFPASLVPFAIRVEDRIDALLTAEISRWTAVDESLVEPLEVLRAFVATGGKRLRPAFCYCAYVGAGGDPQAGTALDAAAALELVHTFALVHDDVMDGSDTRRGADAVHRHFTRRHVTEELRGDPRRFGEGMAILVGDFALVYADLLMRTAPPTALTIYDELRIELCVGQSLDVMGTVRANTDAALANRIAMFKSGKYTVERPLHLGAALAGRAGELGVALSAIGLPLGQAFQLRDDVLGAFGDAETTGKPVGDDLREGKPTPLLATSYDRADAAARVVLERVGAADLTLDDVLAIQDVFRRTGAVDEIEDEITRLVAGARNAIADAPLTDEACELLDRLAAYVAWRDR
jgi:geranylgeranyl diphosphate synthase type I